MRSTPLVPVIRRLPVVRNQVWAISTNLVFLSLARALRAALGESCAGELSRYHDGLVLAAKAEQIEQPIVIALVAVVQIGFLQSSRNPLNNLVGYYGRTGVPANLVLNASSTFGASNVGQIDFRLGP